MRKVCEKYYAGTCDLGVDADCQGGSHPANLDPKRAAKGPSPFSVEKGTSCNRCLNKLLECDKKGRDAGPTDPCSECRHFGAGADPCRLAKEQSVNDAAFRLLRKRTDTHDLPAMTDRLAPVRKKQKPGFAGEPEFKPAPAAMADKSIKVGWTGVKREDLLAKPDWISEDARAHPRSYLVYPGPTGEGSQKQRDNAFVANQQRKRAHNSRPGQDLQSAPKRRHVQPAPLVEPAPLAGPKALPAPDTQDDHPVWGRWIGVDWDRDNHMHFHRYSNGARIPMPPLGSTAAGHSAPTPLSRTTAAPQSMQTSMDWSAPSREFDFGAGMGSSLDTSAPSASLGAIGRSVVGSTSRPAMPSFNAGSFFMHGSGVPPSNATPRLAGAPIRQRQTFPARRAPTSNPAGPTGSDVQAPIAEQSDQMDVDQSQSVVEANTVPGSTAGLEPVIDPEPTAAGLEPTGLQATTALDALTAAVDSATTEWMNEQAEEPEEGFPDLSSAKQDFDNDFEALSDDD